MSAHIAFVDLVATYGSVLDEDTIRGIFDECRGLRSECCDQLTAISGIDPPAISEEGMGSHEPSGMGSDEPSAMGIDYESALATGEEKAKLERDKELNDLMKRKVEDVSKLYEQDRAFDARAAEQRALGPQSLRPGGMTAKQIQGSTHPQKCFKGMLDREKEHCGEFVCFYHSYSFIALLYEVQACVARTLYGLPNDFAPTARLLKAPFFGKPHVRVLLDQFSTMHGMDHNPAFREVAISCSVSLYSPRSEAPPMRCFEQGYSCADLSFHGVMIKVFKDLGASDEVAAQLCKDVATVGDNYNLSGDLFRADHVASHRSGKPGHMMQVFIRVDCVDDVAYGSQPGGVFETASNPLSTYLTAKNAPDGQARIFWHPSLFLDPSKVKVYHYAADEKVHGRNRVQLQEELRVALKPLLGDAKTALRAFHGIEGFSG